MLQNHSFEREKSILAPALDTGKTRPEHIYTMEAGILTEFMNKTGCDSTTAHMFLHTHNWDLKGALDVWYKTADLDKCEAKKLTRGISRAADNEFLVVKARDAIAKDFENNRFCRVNNFSIETPETSFSLPDIMVYRKDFREFIVKDIIEKSVMQSLENSGKLNWWCNQLGYNNKLWPLSTTGDGNCLLHAASLSMYGFHDRMLTLRHALYGYITNSCDTDVIKRRWRWQETKSNLQSGVQYSEEEWEKEWDSIVNMASAKKHPQGSYESLEEIHICFLSNVLRRVIIVISESVLKDSYNQPLSPINFGGIYIPFECDPKKCYKSPLLLTYDMAHFSALVFMEKENTQLDKPYHGDKHASMPSSSFYLPVVDSNDALLPIQFSVDPGPNFNWENFQYSELHVIENNREEQLNLLRTYMDIVDVCNPTSTPENESEDEIERHFVEYAEQTDSDVNNIFGKKNRLEIFGNKVGSLSKSMGKKLKQNLGTLTKAVTKPKTKDNTKGKFLCVEIVIKRHPYQQEMIKNYISFAKERFCRILLDQYPSKSHTDILLKEQAVKDGLAVCINNCDCYATSYTVYLCAKCFETQIKQEQLSRIPADYGHGKSKFYREPDLASYGAVKKIPKSILKSDHTLYLSNSTFFNDTDFPFHNINTSTDLNQNFNGFDASADKENQFPRPRSKSAGQKALLDNIMRLPNKKEIPVEKLITEFDFGQITIPEASRKYLDEQRSVATKGQLYDGSFPKVSPTADATNRPPDINLNILANKMQTMIKRSSENPPMQLNIKAESDL